jgi:hypothetical protein
LKLALARAVDPETKCHNLITLHRLSKHEPG